MKIFDNTELLKKKEAHLLEHGNDIPWVDCPWDDPFSDVGARCCTSSYMREYVKEHPEYKKTYIEKTRASIRRIKKQKNIGKQMGMINRPGGTHSSPLVIECYVHVLQPNPANVTDAQITANIDSMTNDFTSPSPGSWSQAHDTKISFYWDPSCRSDVTTTASFPYGNDAKTTSAGGSDPVDVDSKLNIWICTLSGNLLGFATFPGMSDVQGCVCTISSLLPPHGQAPYNGNRTMTHEVGHYFNLWHIWGDAGCVGCANVHPGDDEITDTPQAGGPNYGCPTGTDSCPSCPDVDMIENYMDYTTDGCMGLFTEGQSDRMVDCINNDRPGLIGAPQGCGGSPPTTPPPTTTPVPGLSGKLNWPTDSGHNIITFLDPDWTGGGDDHYSGHGGTDIGFHWNSTIGNDWQDMVNNPTPVYAALGGTVVWAEGSMDDQCDVRLSPNTGPHSPGGTGCSSLCGTSPCSNNVVIDHGVSQTNPTFRYTGYYHLQKGSVPPAVTVGSTVAQGAKIGTIGSSGISTGPHLHFHVSNTVVIGNGTGGTTNGQIIVGDSVDPFLSTSGQGGSNITESLWNDQCSLPVYNTNTPSGNIPPKYNNTTGTCDTTTSTTTTTTTVDPSGPSNPPSGTTTTHAPGSGIGAAGSSCVKTKGVDIQRVYISEGSLLKTIITTNVEVFFIEEVSPDSVKTWIGNVNHLAETGEALSSFTIGPVTFGRCRIVKASYPTAEGAMTSAVYRGSYNLTIEESIGGDVVSNTDGVYFKEGSILENISEEFSYSVGPAVGQYSVTHNVDITPNEFMLSSGARTPQEEMANLAKGLLDSWTPTGMSSMHSSIHDVLRGAGIAGNLTSSFNRITGQASWTRTINTLATETTGQMTFDQTSSFELDKEGIITVTESGKMKLLRSNSSYAGVEDVTDISANLPIKLAASFTNCERAFNNYIGAGILGTSVPLPVPALINVPIETVRTVNLINQELNYSITYTNDPKLETDGKMIDRNVNVSQDVRGIVNIDEKTSIMFPGAKQTVAGGFSVGVPWYIADSAAGGGRISGYWTLWDPHFNPSATNAFNFNEVRRSLSYNPDGKSFSYNLIYSSDKSILDPASAGGTLGIKKLETKTADKLPTKMLKEYPIPGLTMLVHNPQQSNLGSRQVSFTAHLDRDVFETLGPPPDTGSLAQTLAIRNYLAGLARTELLNVFVEQPLVFDDIFVTDCTWSINSQRQITLSASANYVQTV